MRCWRWRSRSGCGCRTRRTRAGVSDADARRRRRPSRVLAALRPRAGGRARAAGGARTAAKALQHLPNMRRYRAATDADVVHYQWLTLPWLDLRLLPDRPVVLTI